MPQSYILGIDLGGTQVRAARVDQGGINGFQSARINSSGTVEEVLEDIFRVTDLLMNNSVQAIGIGVPSVVDLEEGIVYEVQNIASWKEVPLKKLAESRYGVPVRVNNDANCFALGELYFGKGRGKENLIGLTIGTGLGAGVVIRRRLYAGANCGAGEFGMVDYLDKYFEYYSCGQFFRNIHQLDGEKVFLGAQQGEAKALELYRELGTHLGNAIKMILYTYDMDLIILGGSVSQAYPYFKETLWKQVNTLAYTRTARRLQIVLSDLQHSGILGAAALCYDRELDPG